MISIRRKSRLGDFLFQYVFGRLLADRFGYKLVATPIVGFPRTREEVPGEELLSPLITWEGHWPRSRRTGQALTKAELFEPPNGMLLLDGEFQRFELFADYREIIRSDWLRSD